MFVEFHSKSPETGLVSPVWINLKEIQWVTTARIPGDLKDGQGAPIMTEGAAVNVGGGLLVLTEPVAQVLFSLP
jgi:hypothetical protein